MLEGRWKEPRVNWDMTLPHTDVTVLQVMTAIGALIVGILVARVILAIFRRQLRRTKLSDILIEFLARFFGALLYTIVILIVLSTLGMNVGSVLVSLSAIVGLVLGFGMQETFNNIAAGIWIAALRPIDIGEIVTINGITGKVQSVGILATELLKPDNVYITIPNGQVWGSPIINATRMPTRRVDVNVGVAYGSSVEQTIAVGMELMKSHPQVLDEPAPTFVLTELADSSLNLQLRPWTNTDDYWAVKGDITRGIYEALDKAGIEIPFPQLDVHMNKP